MLLIESQANNDEYIDLQVKKLCKMIQFCRDSNSFWLGYLSSFIKGTQDIEKDNMPVRYIKTIKMVNDAKEDQLISKENVGQLMASLVSLQIKSDIVHKKGLNIDKVQNFVSDAVGQLALNPKYLEDKYFQKEQKIMRSKSQVRKEKLGLECPICCEEITLSQGCPVACGHILHKNCFIEHFKCQVQVKKLNVLCPEDGCGQVIPISDLQEYIPVQFLDKYYDFSLHELVDKNKVMNWCPTPGCRGIFEADQQLVQYHCPTCQKKYCLTCKTQIHPQITCEQNRQFMNLSEQQKGFIDFAKGAHYKQCPSCKFWVQKNKGCDHMTCRCSYQFCFRCGAKYGQCSCDQADSYYGDGDESDHQEDHEEDLYM